MAASRFLRVRLADRYPRSARNGVIGVRWPGGEPRAKGPTRMV